MTNTGQDLGAVSLFETLSPEEVAIVSESMQPVEWQAGEQIYALGDPGG